MVLAKDTVIGQNMYINVSLCGSVYQETKGKIIFSIYGAGKLSTYIKKCLAFPNHNKLDSKMGYSSNHNMKIYRSQNETQCLSNISATSLKAQSIKTKH